MTAVANIPKRFFHKDIDSVIATLGNHRLYAIGAIEGVPEERAKLSFRTPAACGGSSVVARYEYNSLTKEWVRYAGYGDYCFE